MVKQGAIIMVDFAPTKGKEQTGYRPALVVSNTKYNNKSGFVLACPITSTIKAINVRVKLDETTKTQGDILCEQVRFIDLLERKYKVIENVSATKLAEVYKIINALIKPSLES
jgi:mRNA-degrading endonuclease toxin of MazEF toxin-antitoxin module